MGYQITFVPTEEKMKSYKPWDDKDTTSEMLKKAVLELVHYCMKDHSKEHTNQICDQIGFHLRYINGIIEKSEKYSAYYRWKEDENHELWYCGWEFSHPPTLEKDKVVESTLEDLAMLTDVVKTADWYTDQEHFYDKWNAIKEQIHGFKELMEEFVIHDIIEDLREFEKKYEEEEKE